MRNEKKDVKIHSDDEEIEFRVKLNIQFDSVASAPLTENDEIEVLYVPMNVSLSKIYKIYSKSCHFIQLFYFSGSIHGC